MIIGNTKILLPLAMIFLTASILLGRIGGGESAVRHFFEGLCLGLAFTLSVFVFIRNVVTDNHE
ncbi:MAG: hypothetical protein JSV33_08960 [bacterium]|nr:MAG: hypothetical protein JSV33_08960 [bacterium]